MCRKVHGAAFRSRATVKAADFEWVQGEEAVTFYESSPGNRRGFCRVCGSPICVAQRRRSENGRLAEAAVAESRLLAMTETRKLAAILAEQFSPTSIGH
jgi:hypothetical protein